MAGALAVMSSWAAFCVRSMVPVAEAWSWPATRRRSVFSALREPSMAAVRLMA
jgi:hypothetical protein